jgi:TetR/AcrR family transcriptional repressor of nem operon
MATPQPDRTIAAATEIFLRHGYEEASIAEIVATSGANRYSIYSHYGGKHDLFLAALDAYYQERKALFLEGFGDPALPPIEAIRRLFLKLAEELEHRPNGCLMGNIATPLCREHADVAARVEGYFAEMRMAFTEAFTLGAARGELNPALTPAQATELILTLKMGLGVQAQNGMDSAALTNIVEATFRAIGNPAGAGRGEQA